MNHFMQWMVDNGKDTLESLGLILSLGLAASSFRAQARESRIANLMTISGAHRDLWLEMLERPELSRILQPDADLKLEPVSRQEERYVHLLITHLSVTYTAMKNKLLPGIAGLELDVKEFFALPIPREVWRWSRRFQEADFIAFVESKNSPKTQA